jgi:hypothetical protein
VILLTSEKTRAEVLQTQDPIRSGVLELLVALFQKVPFEPLNISGTLNSAPLNTIPLGGSWTDPMLASLRSIFDAADAEHLALAVKSNCAYFLTLDESTILGRARKRSTEILVIIGNMKIVSPVELISDLESGKPATPRQSLNIRK